jgi:hypothetical protein
MARSRPLMVMLVAVVLMIAGMSLARAALTELGGPALMQLAPSSIPSLLGPIDYSGRTGWDCVPEKTARSERNKDAELPDDAGR